MKLESGTFIFPFAEGRGEVSHHGMDLPRLSSIISIFAAINIFYAIYGIIQKDLINTLIPILTFLILIYSAAILDERGSEPHRR
jgi:hypothetical protein